MTNNNIIRCSWANPKNQLYIDYHDQEWGVPVHDDNRLFEMLILEGSQAGLSWETILKRRETYRIAFDNFNPKIVAKYDENKKAELLLDKGIIRNRLKIKSAINNAKVFLEIQKEHGSFNHYIFISSHILFLIYHHIFQYRKTTQGYCSPQNVNITNSVSCTPFVVRHWESSKNTSKCHYPKLHRLFLSLH